MTASTSAAELAACERCASPLEDGDLRCAVCALPVEVPALAVVRARANVLRCTECGAAIGYDASKRAPGCGFCGAVMALEQPIDPIEEARLRVPFAVTRDLATTALRTWLGRRGWFAPKALRDEAVLETVTPLCWAAWIVNATAHVAWTCDSDDGAGRSAWAPHAGELRLDLGNLAIPASRGLRADECSLLVPHYDLTKVVGASATAIAGEEVAMIESFDAQRSAARALVQHAIEAVAKVRVERAAPGRRFRNIHVACLVERQTTDRVALPAWVLAYRYRGSPYRAIVHGQRPELVFGSSPKDWAKIAWLVAGGIAAVLAVIAFVLLRG
ncbi:MAG TPA: hypothetical protein VGF94_21185 [Kofleriaceae bacterium]|jgi:hypothetical protein